MPIFTHIPYKHHGYIANQNPPSTKDIIVLILLVFDGSKIQRKIVRFSNSVVYCPLCESSSESVVNMGNKQIKQHLETAQKTGVFD